ncbi:hypothetical protein D1007_14711 [Hordeum vulgare]|nr:hypothetical protein D1007_14711 [Hordeum vulgare]
MAGKRKAGDDINGTRHRAARTDTTAGDDIAGTSARAAGPTANAAGDGTARTSQALAGPTAATTPCVVCYPGASSQSCGARGDGRRMVSGFAPPRPRGQPLAGHMATTPAFAVGYPGGSSQFGGAARGGFSQSHSRAPTKPMIQPPTTPMLQPLLSNPAVGSAPFPYQHHAPTGCGFFPGQNQIAGHTGTWQPRAHSGRPPACILCGAATTWVLGSAPLCEACYDDYPLAKDVLQQHPQMGYQLPSPVPTYVLQKPRGQQRQPDLRLRRSSSPAPAAVGPRTRAPGDQWCPVCRATTTPVLGLEPLREVCHDYLLASYVLWQHRRMGYVILSPVHSYASSSSSAAPAPEQRSSPREY